MKLAFCLFNYFPYGGLQRDFLRIARLCKKRGHEIHVYTMEWEGELEPGFHLHFIQPKGLTNHQRCASFVQQVGLALKKASYDLHIGFNKMPHLDIYYAADVCYHARVEDKNHWLYRLLPRYQQYIKLEKAVFAKGMPTKILLIAARQQAEYIKSYQTEIQRFHLLTPGINKDRMAPSNASEIRKKVRDEYLIPDDHFLLLLIGSGFKTKGLDRAILGLAALPEELKTRCHLFVIGQDKPKPFQRLCQKHQLQTQVRFLGGREDVSSFLLAADGLVHPAYHENTGTVLLEAIVAGLPVLTNEICGYAHYVQEANAGIVLSSPYRQENFNQALLKMLLSPNHQWRQNGLAFARVADIYDMPTKAADYILSHERK